MRETINHNLTNNNTTTKNNILFDNLNIEKKLLNFTTTTPLIREINKKNWIKLIIDKYTRHWYSKNNEKSITIGEQQTPKDIIKQMWLNENSEDDFVKNYIFSHENNHHVFWYMFNHQDKFPMYAKLHNLFKTIRENGEVWFSQLWSLKTNWEFFYYNRPDVDWNIINTSHEEDFVELLNKYCIKPQLLKDHLNFLVQWDEELLKQKGLKKISQPIADYLFEEISQCITNFVQENWVKIKQ